MSTPCIVATHTEKGWEAIYCHHDGYPSYMYHMLFDYYNSHERALALVSRGDASVIDKLIVPPAHARHSFDHPTYDTCIFYHRDRGEPWKEVAPAKFPVKKQVLDLHYYTYVFEEDNRWHLYINGEEVEINENIDSL